MQGNMKEHLFISFILSPLFSSSYVHMWEVDHKEIWVSKMLLNCGVGELLRIPWTARRSNLSILKEINPKYSLEGLMLKSNTLATWCQEQTHWKRPWCWEMGKIEGKEEKRKTEDKMVEWHHWLNRHYFEHTQEDTEGQGSLECYSSWGCKELDTT